MTVRPLTGVFNTPYFNLNPDQGELLLITLRSALPRLVTYNNKKNV